MNEPYRSQLVAGNNFRDLSLKTRGAVAKRIFADRALPRASFPFLPAIKRETDFLLTSYGSRF